MTAKKAISETVLFEPFKDLKKIIENKGLRMSAPASVIKKAVQLSDEELFAIAMREVREIKEFRLIPARSRKPVALRPKTFPESEAIKALDEIVSGRRAMHLPDTQEYVEWISPDYRGTVIRKLHEGKFSIQDYLDLHGLCVEEAQNAVGHFLRESRLRGHRCIKIIHGRGLRSPKGPVLKDALIKWLSGRHRKNIIAFVTARQCDGGLGALYVLLR